MKEQVIYKYPVEPQFHLDLPRDAQVLTVQMQGDTACVWVQLDPAAPRVRRSFVAIGTGHPFDPTGARYIGTFQVDWIVMHLFEIVK